MLALLRVIIVTALSILITILGTVYAFLRLRNPDTVRVVAKAFGSMHKFMGFKTVILNKYKYDKPAIYIANHQNNYDMLTITNMVPNRTVTIGKKSLLYIPFFGIVYWATGNILIERSKKFSSFQTMKHVADILHNKNISILMFPEGTRSRGRGMLPFKRGAFQTAITAKVPIIPIVCSDLHNKVELNKANNGVVLCEMLPPIDTSNYTLKDSKELTELCYNLMKEKFEELSKKAENYQG